MERYTTLFKTTENLYAKGSPIVIVAGALLKDNQNEQILLQLKFKNISLKKIKAIAVNVHAFDVSGKALEGVSEYQYLDLSANANAEFGQKQAIPLPNNITRSVNVACTSVIFHDSTIWRLEDTVPWEALPKQRHLQVALGNKEFVAQYQRDTSEQSSLEPIQHIDVWLCSCGTPNRNECQKCNACHVLKDRIFSSLDSDLLKNHKAEFEADEHDRLAQENAIATKNRKRRIYIAAAMCSLIIIIGTILLVRNVIVPSQKYNAAVLLLEDNKLDDALLAFESLGDYKDSLVKSEQIKNEITYQEAQQLLEAEEYGAAINAFSALGTYKDTEELMLKAKALLQKASCYNEALKCMEQENYYEALIALSIIGVNDESYKDSDALIIQCVRSHDADVLDNPRRNWMLDSIENFSPSTGGPYDKKVTVTFKDSENSIFTYDATCYSNGEWSSSEVKSYSKIPFLSASPNGRPFS